MLMGKVQIPPEPVYRNEAWSVLAAEEHPEAPAPKRVRRERYTSSQDQPSPGCLKTPMGENGRSVLEKPPRLTV